MKLPVKPIKIPKALEAKARADRLGLKIKEESPKKENPVELVTH